jgi:DNA-binding response OmpR family regulator
MRLLLVEDEDSIRSVIKRGLEEDNYYTVDTAGDGVTGLQLARSTEYAAIILDIMLPGMDGWQLCEELRGQVAAGVHTILPSFLWGAVAPVSEIEMGRGDYQASVGLEHS